MSALVARLLRYLALLMITLGCALAVLPANWLLRLDSPNALVKISAAQGTIWSGQALLSVGQAGYARSIVPMIQWETRWDPLPSITIKHPWLSHPVTLRPHWRGVSMSAASLQIPVHLFWTLDARIAAVQPGGQVSLQWPASTLAITQWNASNLPLTMQWNNASTSLSHVSPLGSYRLTFNPEAGHRIKLQLTTVSGPLMAHGSGVFSLHQGLSFNGHASLDPLTTGSDLVSLNELLALIGPPIEGHTALRIP